jgi:putative nucleotidyltransferase with HDIG domain
LRVAQTLDEMLPRLLDETLAVVGSEAGAIWLYEPERGELRARIARGWYTRLDESPVRPGEGIGGLVFATGEAYITQEIALDEHARAVAREQVPANWGQACIPIRIAAETVGVFYLAVPLPRVLQPEEIHLLTTLAEIAGNAIHRMRLYAQTEQRLQRLSALRAIDIAITGSLDLPVILNVLIDQVISQMQVDAATVLLLNTHSQHLEHGASRGFHSYAITQTNLGLGQSYAGLAAQTRQIVGVPDVRLPQPESPTGFIWPATAKSPLLHQLADEEFVAYFGVPLIAKGHIRGVLELFHRSPLHPDLEWMDFLETLAGQAAIAIDDAELFANLQRSNANLRIAYEATIEGWSRALDLRDEETEGHTQRVTEMTLQLAQWLNIPDSEITSIRRGALLHDIGKMGVPDRILFKTGPLTEAEWRIMRKHPEYAYELLTPIPFLREALDIPYCHHERWDGSGYPRGLIGEQIPLAARIFAVVDVYDALTSHRPYRNPWTPEHTRAYIQSLVGRHFDPQIVPAFLQLLDSKTAP